MAPRKPKIDGEAEREPVGSAGIVNHWNCSVCTYWSADPKAVDAHIEAGEHLPDPGETPVAAKSRATHASPTRDEADAAREDTEES